MARAYRTHRSPGRVQKVLYPYPGYCGTGCTEPTEVPGTGMNVLRNSQKFRVRVRKSYRTSRSSGYCGTGVHNLHKFRVREIPGKTHITSGEEFDLKSRISSDLHGMFSLGQTSPRQSVVAFKGIQYYKKKHHRERR